MDQSCHQIDCQALSVIHFVHVGRVSSSCSTSGTRRVYLVTNPVMNEEKTGKCLRHMNAIVCINKIGK
jgi:hypothetical protein